VNPNNHNQLIVDEEAAEVVKRIYSLSLAGYSAKKIAQNLSEAQILTPGAYKLKNGDTRFTRHVSKHGETKWGRETVQLILKDRVYMGDMENHKSEKVSNKLKKYVNVPKINALWLKTHTRPSSAVRTGTRFNSLSAPGISRLITISKTCSGERFIALIADAS
jgi:hypothetical protein